MEYTILQFRFKDILLIAAIAILLTSCIPDEKKLTRGIGIYPGNPSEDFSPDLQVDQTGNYRNLALLRPAFHSSSYDYNLTAQLITDGMITGEMPYFFSLSTNEGVIPKNEREWVLDHVTGSSVKMEGEDIWLQYEIGGGDKVPEITGINVNGELSYDDKKPGGWDFSISGSSDGINWEKLDGAKGSGLPGQEKPDFFAEFLKNLPKDSTGQPINPFADFFGPTDPNEPRPSFTFRRPGPRDPSRDFAQTFTFEKPATYRFYRVNLNTSCAKTWSIGDFDFYNNENLIEMAPSHNFKSAWMSAGSGVEWVYVDLGTVSTFNRIKLHWVKKAAAGSVDVSDDAKSWNSVVDLPASDDVVDDIPLNIEAKGRYVRIMMSEASSDEGYILSELEVIGKGGMVVTPKPSPSVSDNRMNLSGSKWKIQRASEVSASGEKISQVDFENNDWVVASVPGTVLVSYWNIGAISNPNYSDNQLMISESFFYADFWYRNEFEVPAEFGTRRMFLNFDGINWKALIYVNGKKTGSINGAFIRGKFDVTDLIIPGQKNAMAVLIKKNDHIGTIKEQTAIHPDRNGGILGADNPTYHASVGWDWIPTIRGRNIGIWNDVYLTTTGDVTIEDPFVSTDLVLPDTTAADIFIEVTLKNHSGSNINGRLLGQYGHIVFEEPVSLTASESKVVKLNPATHSSLHFENPKLWWPKGYGDPYLYDVQLVFETENDIISDKRAFKSGVREMTFNEDNRILSLYVNGRRFIGRGGNWGFPESNLNYRGREYDIAVGYHADMNFTMIRNWVGQTGDNEFYEACDRHGVMVWQDFWLANPADGPDPYDPKMFLENAEDMIKRIRNHPSIAIYCGRNEGFPPEVLDTALRALIPVIHQGIHYISNSSMGVVCGGGPYRALPPRDYFLLYGRNRLHSERGMPNVMTYESIQQMLPEDKLWPQNSQWGLHDYCLEGAQGAASFNAMIDTAFGPVDNAKKFTELAQWINYNGYRAMFEGRSKYRKGLILWMSHPAWPSMVWQTYDYYFEPTAAYFGCKKASEPIHIQWNPVYDTIEVVNLNGRDQKGLTARALLINMDGQVQWEKEASLDSNEDTTEKLFRLEFPESLSSVHFIKLILTKSDQVISENFYWRGVETGNYQALNQLPRVKIEASTRVKANGGKWELQTRLNNTTNVPVLMVRLQIEGEESADRILPAIYSDNYMSLMPGESKTVTMSVRKEDSRGEKPVVLVSGFNIKE